MFSDEVFERSRPALTDAAFRILKTRMDAEDVVQRTWLKWRCHNERVRSPQAWLTKVAARAAIDDIRVRTARRESLIGDWTPAPLTPQGGPEDAVSDRAELSRGVLVLLRTLSPLERVAFVLRQGFDWPYEEIAETLNRTPSAVRQLHHRARDHLEIRTERFHADPERAEAVAERFAAATNGGSIGALLEALAPQVVQVHETSAAVLSCRRGSIEGRAPRQW